MMQNIAPEDLVVYTAIFDGYDILQNPRSPHSDISYVCFTDDPEMDSNVWDIRVLEDVSAPREKNRHIKMFPHVYFPEHEYSLYVDGNIPLTGDILALAEKYLSDHDFAAPKYPHSDCIYQEYPHYDRQYDEGEIEAIENQLEYYREQGFPEEFGFTENNVLFRNHSEPAVQDLMRSWWEEYTKAEWSKRDQISFPYVVWDSNFDIQYMEEGPRTAHSYFQYYSHSPSENSELLWRLHMYLREQSHRGLHYSAPHDFLTAIKILREDGITSLLNRIANKI